MMHLFSRRAEQMAEQPCILYEGYHFPSSVGMSSSCDGNFTINYTSFIYHCLTMLLQMKFWTLLLLELKCVTLTRLCLENLFFFFFEYVYEQYSVTGQDLF